MAQRESLFLPHQFCIFPNVFPVSSAEANINGGKKTLTNSVNRYCNEIKRFLALIHRTLITNSLDTSFNSSHQMEIHFKEEKTSRANGNEDKTDQTLKIPIINYTK